MSRVAKVISVDQVPTLESVLTVNTYNELFQLQSEQFDHDRKYHSDIHILPVHQRINHMALHFAKYVGRLVETSNDKEGYNKTITDIFVIALSAANILNINLTDEIAALPKLSTEKLDLYLDQSHVLKIMAIHTGNMAKACESLDHIERFSYREAMHDCVVKICLLALATATAANIDLSEAVRQRLSKVKKKNIFYSLLSRS